MLHTRNHVLAFLAVAVSGSLLYFYFDPSHYHFFPPCPFNTITGLFCPGCGSQRAFHALLHGDLRMAADRNVLFVIFLPFLVWSLVAVVRNLFSTKKITPAIFNSPVFAWTVVAVVIVFSVVRNLTFAPFNWLAPYISG